MGVTALYYLCEEMKRVFPIRYPPLCQLKNLGINFELNLVHDQYTAITSVFNGTQKLLKYGGTIHIIEIHRHRVNSVVFCRLFGDHTSLGLQGPAHAQRHGAVSNMTVWSAPLQTQPG
jgi:hypothetical protein